VVKKEAHNLSQSRAPKIIGKGIEHTRNKNESPKLSMLTPHLEKKQQFEKRIEALEASKQIISPEAICAWKKGKK
jgi:hypothetical protein